MSILDKIVQLDFSATQYIRKQYIKNQIVIHHTCSGSNAKGVAEYWNSTKERIATPFIIDNKGIIYQLYSSKYYAFHLGIKKSVFDNYKLPYLQLDKTSIGIELTNWGELTKKENEYYTCYGNKLSTINGIIEYPNKYNGFHYFEKYSDLQIQGLKELLLYLGDRYKIDLKYNDKIWDVNTDALSGKNGLYTHTSFREDKSDCHPQPELINMLKELC